MEESIKSQEINSASANEKLRNLFERLDCEKIQFLYQEAKSLHEFLLNTKCYGLISQNLSLMGVLEYKLNFGSYKTSLNMLEDAKFLAENARDMSAQKINLYCRAYVFAGEKNYSEALTNLNRAMTLSVADGFLDGKIKALIEKIQNENNDGNNTSYEPQKPITALLNVARTLAAETSLDLLLERIAHEIKKVLNADRCSVFILDKEQNQLWSKVALGIESKEIRFDADKGLAGFVAKTGEIVNIQNAYADSRFNPEIDSKTGYKTETILCMPMRNMKHEILGVFQVLNKINGSFTHDDEEMLVAIGTSAGIAIENARLFDSQVKMIETQKQLFKSFIDTLAASIDARDKITAGHSSRVKMYSELICDDLNLEKSAKDNVIHGAILHDIGKIGIRDAVLQKEGKLTDEEYKHIQEHVKITYDILNKIYLSEEFIEVAEIASSHHEKYDGTGYFRKLAGENICLGGRILAVSDVFDAITSKRHYRDKMPIKDALSIIKNGSGKHFDPKIVDSFFRIRLDRLVRVFLSEVDWKLQPEDEIILSKYNTGYLYDLITSKEPDNFDENEKKFFEIFNHYYNCKAGN